MNRLRKQSGTLPDGGCNGCAGEETKPGTHRARRPPKCSRRSSVPILARKVPRLGGCPSREADRCGSKRRPTAGCRKAAPLERIAPSGKASRPGGPGRYIKRRPFLGTGDRPGPGHGIWLSFCAEAARSGRGERWPRRPGSWVSNRRGWPRVEPPRSRLRALPHRRRASVRYDERPVAQRSGQDLHKRRGPFAEVNLELLERVANNRN
jgi:hypothetical protein